MTPPTVVRSEAAGVTELRLERPERRNALTTAVLRELRDELRAVQDEPATRVVVLTGAGSTFCAGADLDELPADAPANARLARIRLVSEVMARLLALEQPTIAVVQGSAVGAGWGLALACDLCYAAADATFRLPEVAKGFRIPQLLVLRLAQLAGAARAAALAYSGEPLRAPDAVAAGCVARVVEPDALRDAAHELARRLAAQPRASVACVKQPLRALAPQMPFPPPDLAWTEE